MKAARPSTFTNHSPLPNLLLLLPLVSRTSSSPIYLSHHPHRHSNFSAWRSLHSRLHSHQISAASHVILRRDMPCQTELQTSNTRGSIRKSGLALPMPTQEPTRTSGGEKTFLRLRLFSCAGINSDEHRHCFSLISLAINLSPKKRHEVQTTHSPHSRT